MDIAKHLEAFTGSLLEMHRILQDGYNLSPREIQLIKTSLEAILLELDEAEIKKDRLSP